MKVHIKSSKNSGEVRLHVEYEPYLRYERAGRRKANVTAPTLLEALKKMVDNLGLYLTSEDIEDEGYSPEQIIQSIQSTNGDGCDYIIILKNVTTGEVYIDDYYEDDEEDEW